MDDGGFRPVVVAPTYNNVGTLGDILARVGALGLPVIVVDDGCTDGTGRLLANMSDGSRVTVVTHRRNRGKAAALHSGFAAAADAGFTHAVTIDTDGQLDPEEIPALLAVARERPEALVVGRRDDSADGYPTRSRVGRKISNLLVRLESGVRVDDSQCGFRVYPLGLIRAVRCRVGHYGFETEIITRAGWARCPVEQAPVTCRYMPLERRVSHFRPWLDTFRGIRMHLFLLARAMTPLPRHPRWPAVAHPQNAESHWRRFCNWLSPARAWRQLRQSRVGRTEIAAGLAVGVFIANLPAYGFQSILSLYAARRLHLHPLSVLIGSHVSTPPVGLLMIGAAIALGHLLLHGSFPAWGDIARSQSGWWAFVATIKQFLLEWSLGALLMGLVMSALTFVLSIRLMKFFEAREGQAAA